MKDLDAITALELEGYVSSPTLLAEAYRLLRERWQGGARDRETGLRLLFLTWYGCVGPAFVLADEPSPSVEELFRHLGGERSTDGELLWAVALMAELFPYCCGPIKLWQRRAPRLRTRSRELLSGLPRPERFAGRGAYGSYFEHMARAHEGEGGGRRA